MNKDNAHLYLPLVQALADGKTIEFRDNGGNWHNSQDPLLNLPAERYRIKPWSLSRHLPGFRPLRDGEEWHGDWVEEDLLEGWRPVLRGEPYKKGDARWNGGFGPWETVEDDGSSEGLVQGYTKFKTRRPLPEPETRIPLGPADWMKDGPWWIASQTSPDAFLVLHVRPDGIDYLDGSVSHERAVNYQRSNDGITWSLCSKPA